MKRRRFLATAAATAGLAASAGCTGDGGNIGSLLPRNRYLDIRQAGDDRSDANATAVQEEPADVMQEKVNQAASTLQRQGLGTEVYEAAIAEGLEGLFMSNLAVLPTEGVPETGDMFSTWLGHESVFEDALDIHIQETGTEKSRATAFGGRNFLQVSTEAMQMIGKVTKNCDPATPGECPFVRQPDSPQTGRADEPTPTPAPESPTPTLDTRTPAAESSPSTTVGSQAEQRTASDTAETQSVAETQVIDVSEGFSRQVRSPFFMGFGIGGLTGSPEETVIETEDLWPGQCQSVVKEIRGVKVVVRPVRVPIWVEPWFARARIVGFTLVWIWEFVPAEFIKSIDICNENGQITQDISTQVHLDRKMQHFWRFLS